MENIIALQNYLNSISKIIQNRGKLVLQTCKIEIISTDKISCEAEVESQRGYPFYFIKISDDKKIKTHCDCPYFKDSGPCKHIAAVITKLILNNTIDIPEEKANKIKYNSANIQIPYQSLTEQYIMSFSTQSNRSDAKIILERMPKFVTIKELWKGHVSAELKENMWGNTWYVKMDIVDKNLQLQCNCKQTISALCAHKHILLQSLTEDFTLPHVLVEQPTKEELINHSLQEYGFSADDKDIQKLFQFETTESGQFRTIPLQKGIMKTSAYNEPQLKAWNPLQAIHLPDDIVEKKEEADNRTYAYVLKGPYIFRDLCVAPQLLVISGVLNKEKTQLSKKIYTREVSMLRRLPLPASTENNDQIIDIAERLKESSLTKLAKKSQKTNDELNSYLIAYISDSLHEFKNLVRDDYLFNSLSPEITKSSLEKITFSETRPEIRFCIKQEPPFISLSLKVFVDQTEIKNTQNTYGVYYFLLNKQIYLLANGRDVEILNNFINNPVIKVHQSDEENFIKKHLSSFGKHYTIELEMAKKIKKKNASYEKISVYLSEQGNFLLLKPVAHYSEGEVELFSKEEIIKKVGNSYINYQRNEEKEAEIKSQIVGAHADFIKQIDRGFFYLHFDKIFEHGWYFTFFDMLKQLNISVYGLDKIKRANYYPYKPTFNTKISSGIDWFDINIEINFGDNIVTLKEVQKAFLKKENYVLLGDGSIGLLPQEWIEKHASLLRASEIDKTGNAKLTKLHFNILDELIGEISDAEIIKEINIKKQKLIHFEGIKKHKLPKGLTVTLRPYQHEGYNWMMFLDEFGWGGCLADDMGLGKTVQMITFLLKQLELYPNKPNLVVLPTTLIFNWKRELQKFAPNVGYFDYSGPSRDRQQDFSKFSIVLTTYGLMINDIEHLRKTTFNYIILDESQAIKNPASQRFKAVSLLRSRNKIVMTGTPIENNTFDLYAQMTFANPGLLGNITHFQNYFSIPIDKNGDKDAAQSLRKLISPFLLRRTKEQVARDLPDKTEDVIVCEMGTEQRRVYDAFKDNYRQMVTKNIDMDGLGKSSMMVLDALLKLRQICNSPALLNVEENYGNDSIKIKELMRHVTEKTGNHKVLVFSQFTQMLKLVEKEIQQLNITYEYLDGKTPGKDREQKVKNFQEDPSIRVFLISLKAGGVGLNLTEADYVYLIDPWWNPAVEAQAIDRTHRIGQKNKVFAYRMICKDTIEEKVLQLQEKKRKVAKELISTEASFYKQLDKTDIIDLFS